MKKKFKSIIIVVFLFTLFLSLIFYSEDIIDSVIFSISIWKDTLIPSLFPFFLISDLLIEYGFINYLSIILKRIMNKVFYLPKEASFAFLASMFSGFPSGAKYTRDLLDKKLISEDDANYLIMFTHFSNPIFVISMIGVLLLNNKSYGIIILAAHILANIFVALIFRKKRIIRENNSYSEAKLPSFIDTLTNSIFKNLKTLVMLFGIITFFLIVTTVINKLIYLPEGIDSILSGILEMTQGVSKVSGFNYDIKLKLSLIVFIISFGGISVHFQVLSIINDTKIKYKYFLTARVIQAIISIILVLVFYNLFFT